MTELFLTLMRRDGLSEAEAPEMEQEAIQEALMKGDEPEEAFWDLCGLEHDCILELLEY